MKGAGAASINGVFKMQGITHEGCPVYGSLNGFSLSACHCPDESGKVLWGWIIGQAGVAAYGGVTSQKEVIPLTGWQCFEGPQPPPRLHLVNADPWLSDAFRCFQLPFAVSLRILWLKHTWKRHVAEVPQIWSASRQGL